MKFSSYFAIIGVVAAEERRLIKTSEANPAVWLSEQDILGLLQNQTHFMDITEVGEAPEARSLILAQQYPSSMRYVDQVKPMFDKIDKDRMEAFLTTYSSFNNRYYASKTGVEAAKWLQAQIQNSTAGLDITVEPVTHSFPQQSVIARFPGSDPALADEIVIVGAHLDSINSKSPMDGRAPGADDDGSGTTNNLEAFRILAANGFTPKRTVEFHWYAGEEKGLLGSQDIAKRYYNEKKKVVAMTQFDMVAYLSKKRQIAFVLDYTNLALTEFLRKAADAYLDIGHTSSRCGYGCSDHASWYKYGFPSAFPFEDETNPNIHTARDTLAFVDFDNIKEFVKLSIAYLVEIAELN